MISDDFSSTSSTPEKFPFLFALAVLILAIEASLFLPLPLGLVLLLHLFVVTLVMANAFLFAYKGWGRRFSILLALFSTTMGPFGAIFSLLVMGLYLIYRHLTPPISALLEDLFPNFTLEKHTLLYERLTYGVEDATKQGGMLSFQDILAFGNESQKRATIEKILKNFHPEFCPALFLALNDPSNSVRVHAATAITNLDKRFFDRYLKLKNAIKKDPDRPEALLALAQHCTLYVKSEILDSDREEKMRKEATESYEKYARLTPADLQVRLELAKLYLDNQQPLKAKNWLEPVIGQLFSPEIYLTWMQILFELQDYAALRHLDLNQIFSHIDPKNQRFQDVKDYLLLWNQGLHLNPP